MAKSKSSASSSSSSKRNNKSTHNGNGAINNNDKHKTSNRRSRTNNSNTKKNKNNKSSTANNNNYDDDDDQEDDNRSTFSTASSTFSYIQSILERRRHFLPLSSTRAAPPVLHEHNSDDENEEDGTAIGVVLTRRSSRSHHHDHNSNKRTSSRHSHNTNVEHSAKRKHKHKHNNSNNHHQRHKQKSRRFIRPCHPILLLTLIGVASNWVATRILNSMLLEDMEVAYPGSSMGNNILHRNAGVGQKLRQNDYSNNMHMDMNSRGDYSQQPQQQYQQQPRDSLGDLPIDERDTNIINPIPRSSDVKHHPLRYEPMQPQYDGIMLSNDYRNMNSRGAGNELMVRSNNQTGTLFTNNDHSQSSPSSLTKRFVNLRQRLLELYSEDVPAMPQPASHNNNATLSSITTTKLHPLFNEKSPQYQALNWLANIDGLRLRHYSPGLVQRYVLAVLYFSTGGPPVYENTDLMIKHKGPWRNPTMFLAPTHECEWKSRIIDGAGRGGGIRRCDKNKTVVEISLYNELTGSIPSELGRLWNLRTLYLGRNRLTGTIPTELGMIQKLSSLSLQWNDLSGTLPQQHLKNMLTLRALQLEGNEKLTGKIERHSLLCQMRNKYRGPTPRNQEKYTGRRVLRVFTATCVPSSGSAVVAKDRLECECCTECFGKMQKDLIY